jgi:hypothetical protein
MRVGSVLNLRADDGTTPTSLDMGTLIATLPQRTVTSSTTLTASDHTVFVATSGGSATISLPAAASSVGKIFVIKNLGNETSTITIDPNGSEAIETNSTLGMGDPHDSYMIQCDGTGWWIIGHYPGS